MVDILAIAAHPDDVEQTCGGTLIGLAELGYRTGVLDLTAGEMGTRGSPELRLAESEAAGKFLRLTLRRNLRLPDAKLDNTLEARTALALQVRELRPRVVILPYWEARHPDHYRASQIGYEGCFLAGLRKLDAATEPHRPFKVVYAAQYAPVTPSFVVDITAHLERRMQSLFAYASQYGDTAEGSLLFPRQEETRERLFSIARYYGNLIGARFGEAFLSKEVMRVDDLGALSVRSF